MRNINILYIINLFSGMGSSIFAPLFPIIGQKYNLSNSLIGFLIGIFSLINLFISSSNNKFRKKFSENKLLFFATFFEATCVFSYGFLSFIKSFHILISLIILLRIIHGTFSRIINTSIYSLSIYLSNPFETQKIIGNFKKAYFIGIIIGPILASILYKLGGYTLPFIIIGICIYISSFLSTLIDKEMTNIQNGIIVNYYEQIKNYMKNKEIIIILGTFLYGFISKTFFYPCLIGHLEKNFDLSITFCCLLIIIISISYYLVLQNLDSINNKYGFYGAVFIGLLLISLGNVFTYPLVPIPKSIIFMILGFACIGGGTAIIFISGLFLLSLSIKNIDFNMNDEEINEITSSMDLFMNNFGEFFGPVFGGMMSDYLGFKYCCFVVFLIGVFYTCLYFVYFRQNILEDLKKKNNLIFDKKTKLN